VLPEVDPGILEQVVAVVHEYGRADGRYEHQLASPSA
jgi:hypothetical protein